MGRSFAGFCRSRDVWPPCNDPAMRIATVSDTHLPKFGRALPRALVDGIRAEQSRERAQPGVRQREERIRCHTAAGEFGAPSTASLVRAVHRWLGAPLFAQAEVPGVHTSLCRRGEEVYLFATNMTRLALRRGSYLRGYVYDFIQAFAPPLTRERVDRSLTEAPTASFDI